ncbi:hypothetical protein BDV96DRAFT_505149 [Lophiotrema nucula]|uniref:RING-type domain-containing protein n=1 Tax=Lophiotrema nucula TaxID=690887 RepID=A0A6A5YLU6_9PLEO|nr:hypothetical protein BDV96DRAFT_505149 [Lophiotrema nucula]
MLEGPEDVCVDQVSDFWAGGSVESCPVCLEEEMVTRRLRKCGHLIGEECLAQQLKSRVPNRYNCVLCRAYFLDDYIANET